MPKNCSSDVVAVVAYIDDIFTGTNQTAIDQVKEYFGLANVPFTDDAAAYRKPLHVPKFSVLILSPVDTFYMWQAMNVYGTPDATAAFYGFCDALEVKADGSVASDEGWGLDYAIEAWALWFRNTSKLPRLCRRVTTLKITSLPCLLGRICVCLLYKRQPPPMTNTICRSCSYNTHVNVAVSDIDISVESPTSDDRSWSWMVYVPLRVFKVLLFIYIPVAMKSDGSR